LFANKQNASGSLKGFGFATFMTRGHAESAIKTTNGKVSVALTAENMIMCLMLVCLAEVVQLMLKPVVTHSQLQFKKTKTAHEHKTMANRPLHMSAAE